MTMMNRKKVVRLIAWIFLAIGLIGWFIPTFDVLNYPKIELPNSYPQGLYIDGKGNIYCGSRTYERIQKYDKHGKFVRAFDTDVGKGRGSLFTFQVKDDQLFIHVHGAWLKSERLDREILYSLDGDLLQTIDIPSKEYAGYKVRNECNDPLGNHYVFKGFLWPRVVKRKGESSAVIINPPFYSWLFQAPLPAFGFFFISLLFLVGFKNIIRSRKSTEFSEK